MSFGVTCWHCRKTVLIDGDNPRLAVDLMRAAEVAKMQWYYDRPHRRVLVFCNDNCAEAERTNAGNFRLRPKGAR